MAKLNTKESVVDYLKSKNQDSSYAARSKIAANLGIKNYTGSETQNIQMLNTLKNQSNKSSASNTLAQGNGPVKTVEDKKPTVNNNVDNKADDAKKSNLLGVDDDTYNRAFNTPFEESQESKDLQKNKGNALSNLEELTSKDQIISGSVMDALNAEFVVPSAVKEADAYLSAQLEKIQSGKTSYSDQVKDMMDKIMNRDKFSYDVDTDPLFQQALASAMNSGKQAMQDTIGQASALTGGYGSTYATTAGNQAYNAFIEDAYDNLPQYYQMALEAYQMEGEEMYRQFGMVSELDDKEYNRNVTAYDATYQHRNQMYNEAYTRFRDYKTDAFAMANLQLNEHGQKVSDAYNYYNAYSDYADTVYEREYNKWTDDINLAMKYAEMLNTDAWANKNFDEGVRQYEKNYAQTEDHFNKNLDFQNTWNEKNMAFEDKWNQKKMDFEASENAKDRAVKAASGSNKSGFNFDFNGDGVTDSVDVLKAMDSKGVKKFNASVMTEDEFRRRRNSSDKRYDTYDQYIMTKLEEWSNKKALSEYETEFLLGYYFSN